MMCKVLLAVLVISLAYVSDAAFFRDMYPGKNLGDMAECKEKMETEGGTSRIPSRNGWGEKNFRQCAKYCLKQKLKGEQRGDDELKAIVASEWDRMSMSCVCVSGGTATFTTQIHATSCIFETEEKPKEADKKLSPQECIDAKGEGTFFHYNGYIYERPDSQMNYPASVDYCKGKGGKLASHNLDTMAKRTAIKAGLGLTDKECYFIDLIKKDGVWQTSEGTAWENIDWRIGANPEPQTMDDAGCWHTDSDDNGAKNRFSAIYTRFMFKDFFICEYTC